MSVSLIYGLPHIYLASKLGNSYSPLIVSGYSPIAYDEGTLYSPAVNYILQGHLLLQDPYVAEYSNTPTTFVGESASAIIMAMLSLLTGSIEKAFIAADFIFPAAIFTLLYFFASHFIKNHYFAMSAAFVAAISRDFIAMIPNPFAMWNYLKYAESPNEFLYLARAFHPQVSLVFFALGVLLLANLIKRRSAKLATVLGVVFGLAFFTYIFYWTYLLVVIVLTGIYFALRRDKHMVSHLFLSLTIGLVLAIPYLWNTYIFYTSKLAEDFTQKYTIMGAPVPVTIFRYIILAVALYLISNIKNMKQLGTKRDLIYFYIILIFVGILIPLLFKLVLNRDLVVLHYIRRALAPFATIAVFVIAYNLAVYYKIATKQLTIFAAVFLILATVFAVRIQIISSQSVKYAQKDNKNLRTIYKYLDNFTERYSTVGSLDEDLNSYLPTYTQNKVFFPPTLRTITPTGEDVQRYAIISNLLGENIDMQKQNLDNYLSYIFYFQAFNQAKNKFDPQSSKVIIAKNTLEVFAKQNFPDQLKKYKLDYLIISPNELSWVKPQYKYLKPTTSINGYIIFKVLANDNETI